MKRKQYAAGNPVFVAIKRDLLLVQLFLMLAVILFASLSILQIIEDQSPAYFVGIGVSLVLIIVVVYGFYFSSSAAIMAKYLKQEASQYQLALRDPGSFQFGLITQRLAKVLQYCGQDQEAMGNLRRILRQHGFNYLFRSPQVGRLDYPDSPSLYDVIGADLENLIAQINSFGWGDCAYRLVGEIKLALANAEEAQMRSYKERLQDEIEKINDLEGD